MTEQREDIGGLTSGHEARLGQAVDFVTTRMRAPLVDHPYLFTLAVLTVSLLVLWVGIEVLKVFFTL